MGREWKQHASKMVKWVCLMASTFQANVEIRVIKNLTHYTDVTFQFKI